MDLDRTDEQLLVREPARAFANHEIAARAHENDLTAAEPHKPPAACV